MRIGLFKAHVAAPFTQDEMQPVFADADQTVAAIKAGIYEQLGKQAESVKTVESGIVEEHAVVEIDGNHKILLVRLWPVFYSHDKRVEYRLYTDHHPICQIIRQHLEAFSKTNEARLVLKD